MQRIALLFMVMFSVLLLPHLSRSDEPTGAQGHIPQEVEARGWRKKYDRGAEIYKEISTLDTNAQKKFDLTKYRGEKVVFFGRGAPPGSTNDLITEGGLYIRVVSKSGADLRPKATAWSVIIHGTVQQVLPENKLIVIEVEDWLVKAAV